MTDLPKHKMTADEFLDWVENLPSEAGKFELWDGEVVRHGPGGFEEGELAQHWDAKGAMLGDSTSTRISGLGTSRVLGCTLGPQ